MKKNYSLLKITILSIPFFLLLHFCRTEDNISVETELALKKTRSEISYEDFVKEVNLDKSPDKYTSILKISPNKSAKNNHANSNDTNNTNTWEIIPESIIKIEKDSITTYTFGLDNGELGSDFYNLVIEVNKDKNISKSHYLKYTPSNEWLKDRTSAFSGKVMLLSNLDNQNKKGNIAKVSQNSYYECIVDIVTEWRCSKGNLHSPFITGDCTVDNEPHSVTINIIVGLCEGTGSGEGTVNPGNTGGGSGNSTSGGGDNNIITAPNTIPFTWQLKNFESGQLTANERIYYKSHANITNTIDNYLINQNFSNDAMSECKQMLMFGAKYNLNPDNFIWVSNNISSDLFQNLNFYLFDNPSFTNASGLINYIQQKHNPNWEVIQPTLDFVISFLQNNPDTINKDQIFNRIIALDLLLEQNPDALLDIQCQELPNWKTVANHPIPQIVKDKISSLNSKTAWYDSASLQNIYNSSGPSVNMDLFPVKISKMPKKPNGQTYTPSEFFDFFRRNINSLVDKNYSQFYPIVNSNYNINDTNLWNSSNPTGSLIHISIPVLSGYASDDGTVICSGFNNVAWVFTTVKMPKYDGQSDGTHPVSGNRLFGYFEDGNGGMTIYTRGVDRFTRFIPNYSTAYAIENSAFKGADKLWRSMQAKVSKFVSDNEGQATIVNETIYRPSWIKIREYIKGQQPLSSLPGCH